ncbi:MAG TPA: hypothetical protein VF168_09665 [Trueperaceae bacterium]
MAHLLFLFLDGVGLGTDDPQANPFAAARSPFLRNLLGGSLREGVSASNAQVVVRGLDATLGQPGLPQSATGQATLLTGTNCAAIMGRHYGPWPGPTLRKLLDRSTLFSEVLAGGGDALLVNAYPPGYFAAIENGRARTNVPVHAALAAGLALPDLSDYARGEAVAADLTGEYFVSVDARLPVHRPAESGELLARLALGREFTFFDYWPSDRAGHRAPFDEAVQLVERLDSFIEGVVGALEDVTLLITSDHGNLEDKGTRGHTRARVPLIALGPRREEFSECASLVDVAPAVGRVLGLPTGGA